jgi:O-antigen/teichoic acid export membrane protein
MKKKAKYIFDNYWLVLLVGMFFILTCIYNEWGENRNVFWNTYIKTVREGLVIGLFFGILKSLKNTISIFFAYGGIAVSMAYTLFRFYCGIKSLFIELGEGESLYDVYFELMKSTENRFAMTLVIFIILIAINYLNRK